MMGPNLKECNDFLPPLTSKPKTSCVNRVGSWDYTIFSIDNQGDLPGKNGWSSTKVD